MSLCVYKNMLGKSNEGIHCYRVFNIAIADVVMTIIVAFMISYANNISVAKILVFIFALGIFMHRINCVRNTIDK